MLAPVRLILLLPTLVSAYVLTPSSMMPDSVKLFDPPRDELEPKVILPDAVAAVALLLMIEPAVESPVPLMVNRLEID